LFNPLADKVSRLNPWHVKNPALYPNFYINPVRKRELAIVLLQNPLISAEPTDIVASLPVRKSEDDRHVLSA
jgi:hypothetical protein